SRPCGQGEEGILAGGGGAARVRGAPSFPVARGVPSVPDHPVLRMKAVFLDRDGTIVVERGYITVPDAIELIPGAAQAIVRLRNAGWKVYVATTQGCVGKGMITEEELGEINFRMVSMLGAEGAELDGIYVCPHHPDGTVPD